MIKRLFDVGISLSALIILSPILLLLYVAGLFTLGPPVFFIQSRPGLNAKPFKLIKLRTMRLSCNVDEYSRRDALRLTVFGKILRASSLDEIPEFWNVLKGEMSLVGPRPLLIEYLPLYSAEQRRRHEVRPGITGWAQINGRNDLGWEEKFKLDVWYVDNHNIWIDFKILLITVYKVLKRADISRSGEATTSKFTGSIS